jgi:spore germination cell wall hydrolase CwlJ-like protein
VLKDWQFSAWNTDDPNRAKMLAVTTDDSNFREALRLAELAYAGQLEDITGGATNYHTASISTSWDKSMTQTASIGNHVFYA